MRHDKVWYLKKIGLFKRLSQEEMQRIEGATKMERVKRRGIIFFQGEPGEYVYFLKSGRVRLYRLLEDGKELTLDYLEPGDIFGELSIIGGYTHDTVAEAVEEAYVCAMRREDFEELLKRNPSLAFQITKLIGLRLQRVEGRIGDLIYKDIPRRLAYILLRLADKYGINDSRGILLRIKLSHKELASLIGSSRETVTLTMNEFKNKGFIENRHRRIIIKDKNALASLQGRRIY